MFLRSSQARSVNNNDKMESFCWLVTGEDNFGAVDLPNLRVLRTRRQC